LLPRLARADTAKDPPNIVLILADDMGWSDVGCYGGEISTPNIDRLGYGGLRFTQFYNTAKCFPSRACLLTGAYAHQIGMDEKPGVLKRSVTLGEMLRTAGYRTLWAGKHHGTENPVTRGFDHYYGLRDGCCNYFNPGTQREGEGVPAEKRKWRNARYWCIDEKTYQPYTPKEKDFYTTDYFTNYALKWLDDSEDDQRPFFLYMAYTAPHYPLQAWPKDIAKYKGKYARGYGAIRRRRFEKQVEMGLVDPDVAPLSEGEDLHWDQLPARKKETEQRLMEVYAAMIECMDRNIGRILARIKKLGREKNTLIFFCSDNGACPGRQDFGTGPVGSMTRYTATGQPWANVSNTPLRKYKSSSHEGGICSPLMAYWPKVIAKGGRICRRPGHFIDFMPTLLDIVGVKYPETFKGQQIVPLQGESFASVLHGRAAQPRRGPLFWEWSKGKAVRKGKWKLVSWKGKWELYDMDVDRTETKDLAEKHPELVKQLGTLHAKWRQNGRG